MEKYNNNKAMEHTYSQSSIIALLLLKRAFYSLNIALMQISTGAFVLQPARQVRYQFYGYYVIGTPTLFVIDNQGKIIENPN